MPLPARDVAFFLRSALRFGVTRLPAGFLGDRFDQIDRARIGQMLQPKLDRIDARFRREFVDEGLMRERVRQRGHAPQPRRPHDRRRVVADNAHGAVVVRRHGRAVAHFEYLRLRGDRAGQQQR